MYSQIIYNLIPLPSQQRYEIPCASVSTSMTMAWLPGFHNTLLSAEANGVRMFELRGLDRDGGFLSSAPSVDDISAARGIL